MSKKNKHSDTCNGLSIIDVATAIKNGLSKENKPIYLAKLRELACCPDVPLTDFEKAIEILKRKTGEQIVKKAYKKRFNS